MLVSIPLNGTYQIPGKTSRKELPFPEIPAFLKKYPTAKIIVVIDTHCLQESGTLLWSGNSAETYESCTLLGVSMFALA